jgi:dephospho-CoA kinase
MRTPVIGITGSIGTGKSTFARLLTEEEGEHLDADEIAKNLMRPGHEAHDRVVEEFGKAILDQDGFLNSEKLAEVVFQDPEKLETLESILHPMVIDSLAERVSEKESSFYAIEAPLLFEAGADELCDWIVVVTADESVVDERIKQRGLSTEQINQRRSRQLSEAEKLQQADEVVENNSSLDTLKEKADDLLRRIRTRSLEDDEETT